MSKEIDREQLEFITDPMPVVWARLKNADKADEFGRVGYAITVSDDLPEGGTIIDYLKSPRNKDFKRALAVLGEAKTDKRVVPKETYSGAKAIFRTDEDKEYLQGKVFFAAQNLTKPEVDSKSVDGRAKLTEILKTLEPVLFKLNDKGKRIPAEIGDIYPTCIVRVRGYVYHSETWGRYCVGLRAILLCEQGDAKFMSAGRYDPDEDDKLNEVAEADDDFGLDEGDEPTNTKANKSTVADDEEIPF